MGICKLRTFSNGQFNTIREQNISFCLSLHVFSQVDRSAFVHVLRSVCLSVLTPSQYNKCQWNLVCGTYSSEKLQIIIIYISTLPCPLTCPETVSLWITHSGEHKYLAIFTESTFYSRTNFNEMSSVNYWERKGH